jgi:hypothetical protein
MLGCNSGFDVSIKTPAPNSIGTHYAVHREMLAAETLCSGLKQIVSLIIQAVNFINPVLSIQEFSKCCTLKRKQNQHNCCFIQGSDSCPREKSWNAHMTYMTNWRSLFTEIEKKKKTFRDMFCQDEKLNQSAYVPSVFGLLNKLNSSLKGSNRLAWQNEMFWNGGGFVVVIFQRGEKTCHVSNSGWSFCREDQPHKPEWNFTLRN